MADENTNVSGGEATTETAEKRSRVSPRVKLGDEICAMIAGTISDLNAEVDAGANKSRTAAIHATVAALSDLREKVVGIVEAGPVQAGSAGAKHYIGVLAGSGERVAVDSNVEPAPTKAAFAQFSSVLGPFNTKNGVSLRLRDHTVPCPVVY